MEILRDAFAEISIVNKTCPWKDWDFFHVWANPCVAKSGIAQPWLGQSLRKPMSMSPECWLDKLTKKSFSWFNLSSPSFYIFSNVFCGHYTVSMCCFLSMFDIIMQLKHLASYLNKWGIVCVSPPNIFQYSIKLFIPWLDLIFTSSINSTQHSWLEYQITAIFSLSFHYGKTDWVVILLLWKGGGQSGCVLS